MLSYGICHSLSGLFCLVWWSLVFSKLLQMALFQFWWLSKYCIVYIYHIFFIHSSVDRHLGCFHVLATMNSAALNIGMHVSFGSMVLSGYMPRSGIAGSYASSTFSFLKKPPQRSQERCSFPLSYVMSVLIILNCHLRPSWKWNYPKPGGLEEMPDSGLLTF